MYVHLLYTYFIVQRITICGSCFAQSATVLFRFFRQWSTYDVQYLYVLYVVKKCIVEVATRQRRYYLVGTYVHLLQMIIIHITIRIILYATITNYYNTKFLCDVVRDVYSRPDFGFGENRTRVTLSKVH